MSVLVWLVPLVNFVIKHLKDRKAETVNSTPLETRLMFCSLSLVFAVWCLRFATSYYEGTFGLSVAEMIFDSLLQTLQTVTMNVDCREYIVSGKTMIQAMFNGEYINDFVSLYGIYASILNLLAPAASAAALLSVLTTVFPKLKLKASCFRKQYYFSELNERSLALAKSIVNSNKRSWNRPLLVFTDVYVDDENERSSEIYLNAKKLGAICVKNDITHLRIKSFNEKEIFLMDESESDNIKHLSELNFANFGNALNNTFIYVFYQDDSYALIENRVKLDIAEQYKGHKKPPIITRVKEYENLILTLLSQKPLIEPLLCNYKDGHSYPVGDKNDEYNLTIIGSGKIGMQMLLSSSWCGQFYGYKLNINVVSNEDKEDFKKNINNHYPEFIESTKKASALLKIYANCDDANEPYFNLRYGEYDFNKTALSNINCVSLAYENEEAFNIINSDYFLIALGNDEANMLAAERIKKQLSMYRYGLKKESIKNCVVAFAVYGQRFNEILRKTSIDKDYKIELFPFASIEETYSYQNITMGNRDPAAILVGSTYLNQTYKEKTIEEKQKVQEEQIRNIYNIMSSKAREVHFQYRIFSAFLFNKNNIDSNEYNAYVWENLYDFDEKTIEIYSCAVLSEEAKEKRNSVLQYLTWLEHRRWNAYMRSIGFSYDIKKNKNIELKLHGCLCECSRFPLYGHSYIRLEDLKNHLFAYFCKEKRICNEGFKNCINNWTRLPKEKEQVQTDLLMEIIDNELDGTLATVHAAVMDARKKNQIEIEYIRKSNLSENDKENKIKELSQKLENELKEKFKKYLDDIVNKCVCDTNIDYRRTIQYDMLDLASLRNGLDVKYYDFPQETDTSLIESYKEILKEVR